MTERQDATRATGERGATRQTAEQAEAAERFERDPGADRIIAFTDAAVAIALTLLILPLMEAATEVKDTEHVQVGPWLADHRGAIGAFFLSFGLVATYWNLHHRTMLRVRRFEGRMVLANFLWLLGIMMLSITSDMVIAFEGGPLLSGIYLGSILWIVLALLWLQLEVVAHPEAGRLGSDPWRAIGFSVASIVALVIAYVVAVATPLDLFGLFALVIVGPVGSRIGRVLERRAGHR